MSRDREINQGQLAQTLGLSTQQIRNLEREGLPHRSKGRQKLYPLPGAVQWYVRWKQDEISERLEPADWKNARARRERARARLAEIEVAKEEGRLVPQEVVEEIYGGHLLDTLRSGLLNMPGRWGAQLVGLDSPREAEAALKRITSELLEEMSGPAADRIEAGGSAELPEDFPHRLILDAAGIETMSDLLGVEDLTAVKGIGPTRQQEILQQLGT